MGEIMQNSSKRPANLFNSPLEIGLRATSILNELYPLSCSLQRLVIFDYLTVHSDDVLGGPVGLHPKTPHRSGELLIRRDSLQKGLFLYMSKRLLERRFEEVGFMYAATEYTGAFLDTLNAKYVNDLKERASWLIDRFGKMSDLELDRYIRSNIGKWGAEFESESVLWLNEVVYE